MFHLGAAPPHTPHGTVWLHGPVCCTQASFLPGNMLTGQMGCGAISGQNKMALNVLKTHVGSATKVTGILNAIVHSHSSSTCNGALYARFLSSQVELQNKVITAGIITLGKPRSSSFTLLV